MTDKTWEAIVKGLIAVATALSIHVLKNEYDRSRKPKPLPRRK